MEHGTGQVWRFGAFEVDEGLYQLRRAGEVVRLEPKVFDVLRYLVRHHDRVVAKDELLDQLWSGEAVSESVLPTNVAAVRRVIRDDPVGREAIKTVHGRGYHFVAPVERVEPRGAARPESAGGLPFVGRESVMERLQGAFQESRRGKGRLLLLVGEPGIGKTRTAEELANHARAAGARVLTGRCHEGEGAPAFWPWIQILREAIAEREGADLAQLVGPGGSDLAELVPELRERLPQLEPVTDTAPESARFRLFDAVTRLLERLSREASILVVLDDLHWADPATLLLLRFLAREIGELPIAVVGSYRDVELRRTHPLAGILGELARTPRCERVLLRGLSRDAVIRLLDQTAFGADEQVAPDPELVDAAYEMTQGNPFFLGEVLQLWQGAGGPPAVESIEDGHVALPQGVREAVGRRLDGLSDECNRVLRSASVLGRRFRTSVLEQLADRPTSLLLGDLDEAVVAGMVEPIGAAVGAYKFSHLLVQETLYEELSTPERVALHGRAAEVLEEVHGPDSAEHLAELAHHLFQAAPGGDVERAVQACVDAGRHAMRVLAYEEAAAHYARALLACDLAGRVDEAERCELLLAEADARDRAGEFKQQRAAGRRAFEKARALDRPDLLARAALAVSGRFDLGPPYAHGRVEIEDALEALGDRHPGLRAQLLGRLAVTSPYRDSMETRRRLAEQALEAAREIGDPDATIAALAAMGYPALLGPGHDDKRLEIANEVEALARRAGRRDMLPRVHEDRMRSYLAAGDVEAAAREVEAGERLAESLRDPASRYFCSFFHVARAIAEGRFEEAEQLIRDSHDQGAHLVRHEQSNALAVDGIFLYQVMQLLRGKGELDRWSPDADSFAELKSRFTFPGPSIETLQAGIWFYTGRPEESREEFERIARKGFDAIPRDEWWLPTLGGLVELTWEFSDAERARALYDLLLPFADRNLVHQLLRFYDGSVARFLGMLAETFGDFDASAGHFEAALDLNDRMGARAHLAWTQLCYARVLLARGQLGDPETAREALTACRTLAQRCGMARLLDRADELES